MMQLVVLHIQEQYMMRSITFQSLAGGPFKQDINTIYG